MKNPWPFLLLFFLLHPKIEAQKIYGFAEKYFVSFNPYTEEADTLIEFEGLPYINLEFRSAIDRYNGRYFFGGAIPGHEGKFHIIDLNTLDITSYPVYPENIEYDFLHNKLPYEKQGAFYSLDLKTKSVTFLRNIPDSDNGVIFGQIRTYVPQRNEYVYVDYTTLTPTGPYNVAIDASTGLIKCRDFAGISVQGLVTNDCTGEVICHNASTVGFLDPCESRVTHVAEMDSYYSGLNTQLCVYDHTQRAYIVPYATSSPNIENYYYITYPYDDVVLEPRLHPFDKRMQQQHIYDKPLMVPLIYLNDTLFVPWGRNYTWYKDGQPIAYTVGDENYWVPTHSGLYKAKVEFNTYTAFSKEMQIMITGTRDGVKEKALYLYPNPAVDEINVEVETDDVEKVEITDMVGRIVYSKNVERKGNDLLSLDIGMLPQGSYVVSVVGRRNTYAGRFTKL